MCLCRFNSINLHVVLLSAMLLPFIACNRKHHPLLLLPQTGGSPPAGTQICPTSNQGIPSREAALWGPLAGQFSAFTDVWSIPASGRILDTNADGQIDCRDDESLVFISGNAVDALTGKGTCCQCSNTTPVSCRTGVLRVINARTGEEQYSLDKPSPTSSGFAGVAPVIADILRNGTMQILAATGEGNVVLLQIHASPPFLMEVIRTSNVPVAYASSDPGYWGWGGGLSVSDLDADGSSEIAYGATVFNTTNDEISLRFAGTSGIGGLPFAAFSQFAILDSVSERQLLAGKTAYRSDGTILWNRSDLPDGYSMAADLNGDGSQEVTLVENGILHILNAQTGDAELPALTLPGNGAGGKPLIADFDGDGQLEIGIDQRLKYTVVKPDFVANKMSVLWAMTNHHLSSSVGNASSSDFDGFGRSDVVYADDCYLWVFDGRNGNVRFADSRTSFVAGGAPIIVGGNIILPASGVDPTSTGWGCLDNTGTPVTYNGISWKPSTALNKAYRGIKILSP